jgi:hypothetical protein
MRSEVRCANCGGTEWTDSGKVTFIPREGAEFGGRWIHSGKCESAVPSPPQPLPPTPTPEMIAQKIRDARVAAGMPEALQQKSDWSVEQTGDERILLKAVRGADGWERGKKS